jgi:uncharacterized repeat protein (TIGR04052 family)
VNIQFAARAFASPLDCAGQYKDLGLEPADVRLLDLRFYIHDVRLVRANSKEEVPVTLTQDGVWQYQDVALIDFEDHTEACSDGTMQTNTLVKGAAPTGDYDGLKFRLGVPFKLNHEDVTTAPSPLNLTSLYWSWGYGHIFLAAVTSASVNGAPPNAHYIHVGSTGCMGDPALGEVVSCTYPNRPEVSLDKFQVNKTVVVADLAELVSGSNLLTGGGCHSFPGAEECSAPFSRLGIDHTTGGMTPETQVFFHVE